MRSGRPATSWATWSTPAGCSSASSARTRPAGPSVDDDPLGAFTAARDAVQAALDDPATAAQEYDGMFGRTTFAESVDGFLSADLVIHRWDLARATGQDETPPRRRGARVHEMLEPMDEKMRGPGAFGPEGGAAAGRRRADRAALLPRSPRLTHRDVSGSDRHAAARRSPRWRHERPGRHHHRHLLRAVVLGAPAARRTSCPTGRPPRRRPPASGRASGAAPTARRPTSPPGPSWCAGRCT